MNDTNTFEDDDKLPDDLDQVGGEEAQAEEKVLNLDDLLSGADFKPHKVEIPEHNGVIFVKPMKAKDRDRYEYMAKNDKKTQQAFRLFLVQRCACDAEGNLIFPTVEQVGRVSSKVIETIWMQAMIVCGFLDDESELMEKN